MQQTRGYSAVRLRLAANLVAPLCAFLSGPILARTLGVEGRGELAAILVPIAVCVVLLSSSHGEVLAASIGSRRYTSGDLFWPSIIGALLMSLVLGAGLYFVIPLYLHDDSAQSTARWLLLLLPLAAVQACLRGIQSARHQHVLLVREGLLAAVGRLLALLAIALFGILTVASGAWVTAAAMIIPAVILVRGISVREEPSLPFRTALGGHLKRSGQALVGTSASQLTLRIDQALLAAIAGPSQLGLYVVAVSIAELPVYGISAVRQVLLSEASDRQSGDLVARVCRTATWTCLAAAVLGSVVAYPALLVLYGEDFTAALAPTVVLLVATATSVPGGLLTTALVAAGRPGLASLPAAAGLVVTAVLALPLLSFGALGAAILSLIAYATTTVAAVVLFTRTQRMSVADCLILHKADLVPLRRAYERRRPKSLR